MSNEINIKGNLLAKEKKYSQKIDTLTLLFFFIAIIRTKSGNIKKLKNFSFPHDLLAFTEIAPKTLSPTTVIDFYVPLADENSEERGDFNHRRGSI